MSRFVALLLCAALCLIPMTAPAAAQDFHVVTTFYPMYVLTANIVRDIPGVRLSNMTAPQTGCLHDYQLLPADLRALSDASVLVANGAGMESFLDKVIQQYADMPIVDASGGIELIEEVSEGHSHDDGHDHGEEGHAFNGHVWLDPRNAAAQAGNIAEGLAAADPDHAAAYRENAAAYAAELLALYDELAFDLAVISDRRMVVFHDAYPYFAQAFDMQIVAVFMTEEDAQPGTRELTEWTDLVREENIRALFAEPLHSGRAPQMISAETGVPVYTLDPVTTGEYTLDAYQEIMRQNAAVLKEALAQ